MTMDYDDSDVPPLEDMEPVLKSRQQIRETMNRFKDVDLANEDRVPPPAPVAADTANGSETKKKGKKSEGGFGGFNKGFLSGGSSKKSTTSKAVVTKKKIEDDVIRPTGKKDEPPIKVDLPDQLKPSDQMIEMLLKDKNTLKHFNNPKVMKAMEDMGKDPRGALAKYGHDKEVMDFFKSWGGFLEKVGDSEGKK